MKVTRNRSNEVADVPVIGFLAFAGLGLDC